MVHLNVANLSTDNAYTAHLFWPEESEDTDKGMKLFAQAVCGDGGFEREHLVPASHYPEAMAQEWEHADKVDGLAELITRLTVDGHMCEECVDNYRAEVRGLKHLGRKYYPDTYNVEDSRAEEALARWAEEHET